MKIWLVEAGFSLDNSYYLAAYDTEQKAENNRELLNKEGDFPYVSVYELEVN